MDSAETKDTSSVTDVNYEASSPTLTELAALSDNESLVTTEETAKAHTDVDTCIDESHAMDLFSIADLVRGQKPHKKQKQKHLEPLAFVRLNTRHGKPKPVTIRAPLDGGGSEV